MRELVVVLAVVASGFARAESAQLAQVSKLSGLVRVARAGSEIQAQAVVAMPLFAGDTVNTLSGKAEIAFADGHLLRMAENTKLEVSAPPDKSRRGVFTRLFAGSVRAIVKKIAPGTSFEIQSSYAIASVKGTDAFFDGRVASVRDEGDSVPHMLDLISLDGRTRVEIREGMTGGFNADGSVLEPRAADQQFFEALDRAFDVAAAPPVTGGGEAPAGGGDGAPGATIDRDALRADLADFADSNGLSEYSDYLEHAGDIALGRVLVDMHGYRVRVEEYVGRPQLDGQTRLDTIRLLVLNSREGGPNAGLSTYQDDLRFNEDLPDNYEDIRRGLPAAFRDGGKQPHYWPLSDTTRVTNPHGDYVRSEALFGAPEPVFADHAVMSGGGSFTWYYDELNAQTGWGQTAETRLFVGTPQGEALKEHFLYDRYGYMLGGWYAGMHPVADYPANSYSGGGPTPWSQIGPTNGLYPVDMYMDDPATPGVNEGLPGFNNPNFGAGTRSFAANARGGFTARTLYGDGSFLNESFFFVADDGRVLDSHGSFSGASAGGSSAGEVPGNVNFEMVWEASEFAGTDGNARTIDLMIAPEIYNEAGTSAPAATIDASPPGALPPM
jgi:hypothetical protein